MGTELELIEHTDTKEDSSDGNHDSLTHFFCAPCMRKDSSKGLSPMSYCKRRAGFRHDQMGPLSKANPGESCIVCVELVDVPCERCGQIGRPPK